MKNEQQHNFGDSNQNNQIYCGEVAYIYAFDIAYEMKRKPIDELFGQSLENYSIGPSKRNPQQLFFYQPQMVKLSTTPARLFFQVDDEIRADNARAISVYNQFTQAAKTALVEFLYFGFLLILQTHLCDYIDIVDVEIDVASNDILDLPNYTLVLPLEVVEALRQVSVQREWKRIVSSEGSIAAAGAPNESYIAKTVKYMQQQLGIPNIFVVDQKKNTVYYRLQHMSGQTQKATFKKLDSFVKLHLTRQQNIGDRGTY